MSDTLRKRLGVGAGGCAVLFAYLTRDVAILVEAADERDFACAAGGLDKQIANAVIAVYRYQGAGGSFNPPPCRSVGIGNHIAIDIHHEDEVSLPVVLVNDRSLGAGNLRDHAKLVVAVVDGLLVAHVLGEQVVGLVVLKGKHSSIRLGDGGKPALRRVAVLHPVAQCVRLAGQVAVLIVGVAGRLTKGVRHLGDVV